VGRGIRFLTKEARIGCQLRMGRSRTEGIVRTVSSKSIIGKLCHFNPMIIVQKNGNDILRQKSGESRAFGSREERIMNSMRGGGGRERRDVGQLVEGRISRRKDWIILAY